MEKTRRSFRASSQKWMAVCMCGVVLLCSGLGFGEKYSEALLRTHLRQVSEPTVEADPDAICEVSNQVTVNQKPVTVTLSKNKLGASLHCTGGDNLVVPGEQGKVCSAQRDEATVDECKNSAKSQSLKQVALEALLDSSSIAVMKKELKEGLENKGEAWTLHLQAEQLPLSDKSFFIGCQKKTGGEATNCKVTIKVEARDSSVHSNSVTCAYGTKSNGASPLQVEMTEEHNTLKLDCGPTGSIQPTSYESTYCEDPDMKTCGKPYTKILPAFEGRWWTKAKEGSGTVELKIPASSFPTEDRTFYIGCTPKDAGLYPPSRSVTQSTGQSVTSSSCTVMVTVKAASASSRAMNRATIIAAVAGAASLSGGFAAYA
ncbi:SAG-related sequence [Besnoitia besnoiti]|uniref:SAG-related sequence n=1 Tax=Besnoitia besnoiti TaxID=94643 RepID=A0A2A9ML57_BESBE|nr:SAG-related sequence [Besnoitia besnoiti]PFH36172.1 SAG-related sequence [Besnoitia besnoiti]